MDFKDSKAEKEQKRNSFSSILKYFFPHKKQFVVVFCIMLIVTLLQAMLPFISKAVIDVGIKTSDVNFIHMVLIGNISILFSVMLFNVMRDWILMHITSRVNISLISDYLIKLMKLPVSFFENKLLGDILQRAQDHERIRSFIMNNSLALIFSALTFVILPLYFLCITVLYFIYSLSVQCVMCHGFFYFFQYVKSWIGNISNCCQKSKLLGGNRFCHTGHKDIQLREASPLEMGGYTGTAVLCK